MLAAMDYLMVRLQYKVVVELLHTLMIGDDWNVMLCGQEYFPLRDLTGLVVVALAMLP